MNEPDKAVLEIIFRAISDFNQPSMLNRAKYVESYWENVASFESLVCKSQVGQYKPVNDIVIHVQESHHSDRILPVFSPVQDTYFVKKVPIFLQK